MKSKKKILVLGGWLLLMPMLSFGEYFAYNSSYHVCFTPKNNCAEEIKQAIGEAKKQILVQAYSFTDLTIAHALIAAKNRGVDLKIILDKSQLRYERRLLKLLTNNKIKPIIVGDRTTTAHNKVIIIDGATIITGSANYTYRAQNNEENTLTIKDMGLAQQYVKNWQLCAQRVMQH